MFSLDGQIALVTGGSQGIGRATALVLARCGADVALMARSLDKCEAVADEVRAEGRRARIHRDADDRRAQRGGAQRNARTDSAKTPWDRSRRGPRGCISGLG